MIWVKKARLNHPAQQIGLPVLAMAPETRQALPADHSGWKRRTDGRRSL